MALKQDNLKIRELSMHKQEIINLHLYTIGMFISVFGSSIYTFAISLYVLKITDSALSFATTLILGIIPMIFINPIAGVLADRLNKKTIVVLMDTLSGLFFGALYLLSQYLGLQLWMIYLTTILMSISNTFYSITFEAAKVDIVTSKKLLKINSLSKIIDSSSQILGPMIGGIVFALFDIQFFLLFNSLSFLISSFLEYQIDFNLNKSTDIAKSTPSIHLLNDMKEGFNYFSSNKSIQHLFVSFIGLNFFLGFCVTVPIPYITNTILKLGVANYGIVQSLFPIGIVIGAITVKFFHNKISYAKLINLMIRIISLLIILIGCPFFIKSQGISELLYIIYYSGIMFSLGICISFIDIPIFFILQTEIPKDLIGRVLSLGMSLVKIALPLALIISGILINYVDSFLVPLVGGIVYLLLSEIYKQYSTIY